MYVCVSGHFLTQAEIEIETLHKKYSGMQGIDNRR